MSFSSQVSGWSKETAKEIVEDHKIIVFDLFGSVIQDTPVDEGRLAGNWQITDGHPASGTLDELDKGAKRSKTKTKIKSHLRGLKSGEDFKIFLTNNLHYANRIEYGGWSHTKAPKGMVRINLIRVQQNLKSRF